MSPDWPPGRSEADLLVKVTERAGAIRRRRRIQAGGIATFIAVVAVVVPLVVSSGHSPRSLASKSPLPANSVPAVVPGGSSAGQGGLSGSSPGGASTSGGTGASTSGGTGSASPQGSSSGSTSPGSGRAASGGATQSPGETSGQSIPKTHPASTAGFVPLPESVSPPLGPRSGGTTVIIRGIDLENVQTVLFGTVPARSFHIDTSTQITAVTPAGAEPGTVVISAFDKSGQGGFDPLCVPDPFCPSAFTYSSNATTTG